MKEITHSRLKYTKEVGRQGPGETHKTNQKVFFLPEQEVQNQVRRKQGGNLGNKRPGTSTTV